MGRRIIKVVAASNGKATLNSILASIEDPAVIEKILKHVGLDEESQTRNRSPPSSLFSHSTQLF
ncbi:MAG: hypothetical protein HN738_18130 [Gammaproteobacteria bacterium]|nr:hypothetical protein [Gammaproteobacteria bacterium]MBT5686282.1 hypothetical protein [Gammaproteobacteria bacterium]MBT5723623.1 hypothetical protein [Gammaproteobacteria bacterium]MBT7879996.1 hypothetical protein [Gammaproteobacteria bacterium]